MIHNTSPKEIIFKNDSQEELAKGVNVLADAVKITMGPGGENVIIEQPSSPPILTKDGVTVAKAIALSLPFQDYTQDLDSRMSSVSNILPPEITQELS